MTPRRLTIPTMGKPYVRAFMPGHRQFQTLSRRAATKHEPNTPAIVAGRGTGENA